MTQNKLVTLEQIHKNYVTVWDTCALIGYLPQNRKKGIRDTSEFADFFMDKIHIYACFIPESVKKEYTFGKSENLIKNTKRGKLIKKFQSEDRILSVEDFPLGPKVKKADFYDRFGKKYGISKTDSLVFAWAFELSRFFDSAAIISNDIKGLSKFWEKFISKKNITRQQLGFFSRERLDLYKER